MISKHPWYDNVVEAKNYDAYYCCFDDSTQDDPDPTATYERDYGPLEKRIAKVLKSHGVPGEATSFFDGWCSNRTRHVTCESRFIVPAVLIALHALLRRKYEFWRIELTLVGSIGKDDERGKVGLTKSWALCYKNGKRLVDAVKRMSK